jgi:hypothetical protein
MTAPPVAPDAVAVARALRGGVATLEALRARLGGAAPEAVAWALEEAAAFGWVRSSAAPDCGPDGVCSTGAPTVVSLTPAGREAARS